MATRNELPVAVCFLKTFTSSGYNSNGLFSENIPFNVLFNKIEPHAEKAIFHQAFYLM